MIKLHPSIKALALVTIVSLGIGLSAPAQAQSGGDAFSSQSVEGNQTNNTGYNTGSQDAMKKVLFGAAGVTGGLATPGCINWLVASARDANLFS